MSGVPGGEKSHGRRFRLMIAAVNEFFADNAAALATFVLPLTVGPPVTELPGKSPRSPLMKVGPVFVIVVAASTPYEVAFPKLTQDVFDAGVGVGVGVGVGDVVGGQKSKFKFVIPSSIQCGNSVIPPISGSVQFLFVK